MRRGDPDDQEERAPGEESEARPQEAEEKGLRSHLEPQPEGRGADGHEGGELTRPLQDAHENGVQDGEADKKEDNPLEDVVEAEVDGHEAGEVGHHLLPGQVCGARKTFTMARFSTTLISKYFPAFA